MGGTESTLEFPMEDCTRNSRQVATGTVSVNSQSTLNCARPGQEPAAAAAVSEERRLVRVSTREQKQETEESAGAKESVFVVGAILDDHALLIQVIHSPLFFYLHHSPDSFSFCTCFLSFSLLADLSVCACLFAVKRGVLDANKIRLPLHLLPPGVDIGHVVEIRAKASHQKQVNDL